MNVDVIAALVARLKADGPVAALVGTRVYGSELPAADAAAMPRKAIVLEPSAGPSLAAGTFVRHDSQNVDAFCYGETPFEAGRVRRLVHGCFKQLRREVVGGVLLHWIEPAGGFADLRDIETGWPVAFQSFQSFFAETAAS